MSHTLKSLKLGLCLFSLLLVIGWIEEHSLSALCFARGCGNDAERPAWGGNGGWWGGGREDWYGNDAINSSRFSYSNRCYHAYYRTHYCQEVEDVNGGALYWNIR